MKSNRRDFLKSAGVAGVGLGLGGWSPFAFAQSSEIRDRHMLPPDILRAPEGWRNPDFAKPAVQP